MTAVDLIVCPYDLGRRNWRCGLGPGRILESGAIARLSAAGHDVGLVDIEAAVAYESESELVFEAQRQIAAAVARSCSSDRLPIVLGGNCNTAVGGISGIDGRRGVIWFDAHGDFCTPETSDSGFLDGMGLAMTVGRGWRNALSSIPGYRPVEECAVALVGARDLDTWEVADLAASDITELSVKHVRTLGVAGAFEPVLKKLAAQLDHVYLHVDLDVHDPETVPVNYYNSPDGLFAEEVCEAIAFIGQHLRIAGGGIASYDPSFDGDGRTAEIAVGVLQALVDASLSSSG